MTGKVWVGNANRGFSMRAQTFPSSRFAHKTVGQGRQFMADCDYSFCAGNNSR